MQTPQYADYQFVSATLLTGAETQTASSIQDITNNLFTAGLVNPTAITFNITGLVVSVTFGTNARVLFDNGIMAGGYGVTAGATDPIYAINLASFVPGTGSTTVYIAASAIQIGQQSTLITGPSPGHPDFDPQFTPFTFYDEQQDSVLVSAITSPPNNTTSIEICRVVLSAGEVTIPSVSTTYQQRAAAVAPPILWSFSESAVPASPILLNSGDKVTITFTSVASVPLHIVSVPGVYRATLVLVADNSTNVDIVWYPNDAQFLNAFSAWTINSTDGVINALGNATTPLTYIPNTVSPYVADAPKSFVIYEGTNGFYFSLYSLSGSGNPPDTINNMGPSINDFVLSTYTAAKMIKQTGGVAGGPSGGFSYWNDTSTAWTSLGTITDTFGTSISGTVIVERLA